MERLFARFRPIAVAVIVTQFAAFSGKADDTQSPAAGSSTSSANALVRIDHAGLNVSNLTVSAAFYKKLFGFEVVHKWNTTWMVGKDAIRLGLFERPKATKIGDIDAYLIPQHVAFLVSEAGFNAYLARLKKLGFKHNDDDSGIAKSVFVSDPDGISIEVIYYYKDAPPLP